MHDPVKSPSHYQLPGLDVEAIDVIRAVLTPEQFEGYCLGNMLKYLLRQGRKDEARQDWGKVGKYHEFLMTRPATESAPGAWNEENRQQCCRDLGIGGTD